MDNLFTIHGANPAARLPQSHCNKQIKQQLFINRKVVARVARLFPVWHFPRLVRQATRKLGLDDGLNMFECTWLCHYIVIIWKSKVQNIDRLWFVALSDSNPQFEAILCPIIAIAPMNSRHKNQRRIERPSDHGVSWLPGNTFHVLRKTYQNWIELVWWNWNIEETLIS